MHPPPRPLAKGVFLLGKGAYLVWLTDAKTPENLRIYAIGDVHGCLNHLQAVHHWIDEDLARHPASDWTIVHVGDYVDRGDQSREVMDYLIDRSAKDDRNVFLLGNHDLMFKRAIEGDERLTKIWLRNGGETTLASYGLSLDEFLRRRIDRLGFDDVIPESHLAFIDSLKMSVTLGDFYFVHAGIDPDRHLADQEEADMLWIRDRFVDKSGEYEAIIVHGHTPTRKADVRSNRIGIDTGAVFGGDLCCLLLDDMIKGRVVAGGRAPLI